MNYYINAIITSTNSMKYFTVYGIKRNFEELTVVYKK